MNGIQRIGVVSDTRHLGVAVLRNVIISHLHGRYPRAEFHVFSEQEIPDSLKAFYHENSWIKSCLVYPAREAGSFKQWREFLRHLKRLHLDLCIFSPHSRIGPRVFSLAGIPWLVGADENESQYLTHKVGLPGSEGFRGDDHWSNVAAGFLRALNSDADLQVSQLVPYIRVLPENLPELGLRRPLVSVHAGGDRTKNKRWPLERFIAISQYLVQRYGASLLLLGGHDFQEETRAIRSEVLRTFPRARVHDAAAGSINRMANHIAASDLYIGNDSGPLQMAVALGRRTIGLHGPAPLAYAAADRISPLHITLSGRELCQPCEHACRYPDQYGAETYPRCTTLITLESVRHAVDRQMKELENEGVN